MHDYITTNRHDRYITTNRHDSDGAQGGAGGPAETPMSPAMRLVLAFVAANAFAAGFFLGSADGAQFFWPLRPPLNAGMVGALYLAAGGAVAYAALGGARGRSPPCSWSPPRSSP